MVNTQEVPVNADIVVNEFNVDMMCNSHLECDGPVLRFTVLLKEQLQSLSGHAGLPPTEKTRHEQQSNKVK